MNKRSIRHATVSATAVSFYSMNNTTDAKKFSLNQPPSPSTFARKRPPTPLQARQDCMITVSSFTAVCVGNVGLMTVAIATTIGESMWQTSFSEVFLLPQSKPIPRPQAQSPLPWPLVEVCETHPSALGAKKLLVKKIDAAVAAIQRVHGSLPVLIDRQSISDYRCHLRPRVAMMRMATLRSVAHGIALARAEQALPVLLEFCPQQGSLFAARMADRWEVEAATCLPMINAGLRPLVIATDAARSHRSATVAVATSTGTIHTFRSEQKLGIRELEMEGIASAMVHFSAKYPNRKIVILSDSRPALSRIAARGFGIDKVDAILATGLVTLKWVRGHNGHGLNDIADRAARILRMKIEWAFSDDWFTGRFNNLRAELLENLRTDSALNSYFYGTTQADLALAG